MLFFFSTWQNRYINEFFIHGNTTLSIYLLNLFNKLFKIGYFPHSWSEVVVVPLHNKGCLNDENNLVHWESVLLVY